MNQSFFQMFPEDAEHAALSDGRLVENSRCCVLDLFAKAQELCAPLGSKHPFDIGDVVHRGAADLKFDCLVAESRRLLVENREYDCRTNVGFEEPNHADLINRICARLMRRAPIVLTEQR
jgi:hypothetical protein